MSSPADGPDPLQPEKASVKDFLSMGEQPSARFDRRGTTPVDEDEIQQDRPAVAELQRLLRDADERIAQLEEALESNRRIGMAIGILMALSKTTDDVAFEILRRKSMATNRRVKVLAEYVINVGQLPSGRDLP